MFLSLPTNGQTIRGVLIAIHKECNFQKEKVIGNNGEFLLVAGILNGVKCVLGNIYAPGPSHSQCLNQLSSHLVVLERKYRIILGGDFNTWFEQIDSNAQKV